MTDNESSIPIACELGPADRDQRVDDWRAVAGLAARRERTPTGETLHFERDGELAARLAALAVAETDCCRFFRIAVVADDRELRLEIEAPADAHSVLDALFR